MNKAREDLGKFSPIFHNYADDYIVARNLCECARRILYNGELD